MTNDRLCEDGPKGVTTTNALTSTAYNRGWGSQITNTLN